MAGERSGSVAGGRLGSLYALGAAGGLTDGQLLERFLSREDPTASEAAFAELVERHGALVQGICRRELADAHDASDAFQATFLVLVSKAPALRQWETVGGWLVGIARRVSARARVESARRRKHLVRLGTERAESMSPAAGHVARPGRARSRPADRRGCPPARAVPGAGGPALLRRAEHRGDRATARLRAGDRAVAAVSGSFAAQAAAGGSRSRPGGVDAGGRRRGTLAAGRECAGGIIAGDGPRGGHAQTGGCVDRVDRADGRGAAVATGGAHCRSPGPGRSPRCWSSRRPGSRWPSPRRCERPTSRSAARP